MLSGLPALNTHNIGSGHGSGLETYWHDILSGSFRKLNLKAMTQTEKMVQIMIFIYSSAFTFKRPIDLN